MSSNISYLNITHSGKQNLKREKYNVFSKFINIA